MSTAHTMVRGGRLRLAVAGAAVLTALMATTAGAATAGASEPTPGGMAAVGRTWSGAGPSTSSRASAPAPGFLPDRGRYTPVAIPPRLAATAPQGIAPIGINDRGQIVGAAGNPEDQASPEPTDTPPLARMA